MAQFNPLTDAHRTMLQETCSECVRIRDFLARLERVGLPVDPQKEQVNGIHRQSQAILGEFFPGQS